MTFYFLAKAYANYNVKSQCVTCWIGFQYIILKADYSKANTLKILKFVIGFNIFYIENWLHMPHTEVFSIFNRFYKNICSYSIYIENYEFNFFNPSKVLSLKLLIKNYL